MAINQEIAERFKNVKMKDDRLISAYDDLTDEQKARFQAVMEKLDKLAVPELLVESSRLRLPKPITPELKPRYRSNLAGAIAAQKVLPYINELHAANERRIALFHEINRMKKEADELESTEMSGTIRTLMKVVT